MKVWFPIGVVVLAAAGWSMLSGRFAAVPVDVAEAERGPVREYVDERGKTRLPIVHRITMPQAGWIEAITLEEGTRVEGGQEVARIAPRDLELAVEQAIATVVRLEAAIRENDDQSVEVITLEQAISFLATIKDMVKAAAARVTSGKAKYAYAIKSRQRIEQLTRQGARTEDDLDRAKLSETESSVDYQQDQLVYNASLSLQAVAVRLPEVVRKTIGRKRLSRDVLYQELAAASASLEQIRIDSERGTMTSPVDGVVLRRHVAVAQQLPAGQLLLEIGDTETLEVEAEVLSQDAVRVKAEQKAEIYGPAIGSTPAKGRVDRVYPGGFTKISSLGVEQQRVLVIVRFAEGELARLQNERGLGVDYRVRVRMVTDERPDALRMPRSALFRGATGQWQVFSVRGGKAMLQTVAIGLINDEWVEVTEGLSLGEPVVVSPPSDLLDGSRVRTVGER